MRAFVKLIAAFFSYFINRLRKYESFASGSDGRVHGALW